MLEFFRRPEHYRYSNDMGYCSGRVLAGDRGGVKEFDGEKFAEVINPYCLKWIHDAKIDGTLTKEQRRELWESPRLSWRPVSVSQAGIA